MTDASPSQTEAICATLVLGDETLARRIADLLTECFDESDIAVAAFETGPQSWTVSAYFGAQPDEALIRSLVANAAGDEAANRVTLSTVATRDWVRESLEGLKPVSAGRFLVHGAHDRARVTANRVNIEIEAALAFGTGHHGTTRGCLILLDELLKRESPVRVLDVGTGSGVLAMAAAKVLRQPVLATEIDPQSTVVAQHNARLNGVGHLVEAITTAGLNTPECRERGPFDLVMANILAGPLRGLAPQIAAHLAPSAHVILSGLLPDHVRGVLGTYRAQGLTCVRRLYVEGWASLLLRRA